MLGSSQESRSQQVLTWNKYGSKDDDDDDAFIFALFLNLSGIYQKSLYIYTDLMNHDVKIVQMVT